MPIYILYSLIFAIFRALILVSQKVIAAKLEKDWKVFSFIYFFSTFIPAIVFYLIAPWKINGEIFKAIFPVAILTILGGSTFNYVIYKKDASLVGGLQPLKLIFVTIFSFLILNESFSIITYLLIGVLIIGSVLVIVDEHIEWKDFFNIELLIFILSQILFSLSDILTKKSFTFVQPISFMSINLFFISMLSLLFIPFTYSKLRMVKMKSVLFTAGNSIGTFFVVIFLVLAFQTNVTISNVIGNLLGPFMMIFTVILGLWKPNLIEKHNKKVYAVRILGTIISYLAAGMIFFTL